MEDLTSTASHVESELQVACEDACSICLEPFSGEDPAAVTSCRHEYHLQCILEWSQRSKECPICWQSLSLKDPVSQELLAAVGNERSSRTRGRSSNASLFPRMPIEDFEFHHVPSYTDDSDFDECIMQHMAAAAVGRAHRFSRRERLRGFAHGHSQFLAFAAPSSGSDVQQMFTTPSPPETQSSGNSTSHEFGSPTSIVTPDMVEQHQTFMPPSDVRMGSDSTIYSTDSRHVPFSPRILDGQTPPSPRRSRQSEFLSFSESLKSRLSAASSRYKESISKSTRGFKEKLLARNNSVKELSKEVQREVTAGIAGVARMMERMDSTSKRTGVFGSASSGTGGTSDYFPKREGMQDNLITRSPPMNNVDRDANEASSNAPTDLSGTPASPDGHRGVSHLQELDNSSGGKMLVKNTIAVSSSA